MPDTGAAGTEIEEWLADGVAYGDTHMLVVYDSHDHNDYPVYVSTDESAREAAALYDGRDMQILAAGYDLRNALGQQLAEDRPLNF